MLDIRPISDLRNKFTEIEREVQMNEHIILTKNGYGTMVVLSLEEYTRLVEATGLTPEELSKTSDGNFGQPSRTKVYRGFKR